MLVTYLLQFMFAVIGVQLFKVKRKFPEPKVKLLPPIGEQTNRDNSGTILILSFCFLFAFFLSGRCARENLKGLRSGREKLASKCLKIKFLSFKQRKIQKYSIT